MWSRPSPIADRPFHRISDTDLGPPGLELDPEKVLSYPPREMVGLDTSGYVDYPIQRGIQSPVSYPLNLMSVHSTSFFLGLNLLFTALGPGAVMPTSQLNVHLIQSGHWTSSQREGTTRVSKRKAPPPRKENIVFLGRVQSLTRVRSFSGVVSSGLRENWSISMLALIRQALWLAIKDRNTT